MWRLCTFVSCETLSVTVPGKMNKYYAEKKQRKQNKKRKRTKTRYNNNVLRNVIKKKNRLEIFSGAYVPHFSHFIL